MRIFCLVLFCAFTHLVVAQDLLLTPMLDGPCMPGVLGKSPGKGILLEYQLNPNTNLEAKDDPIQRSQVNVNRRFKAKLKIPLINRSHLKMMLGWNYYHEEYQFDPINSSILSNVDGKSLKSSRLSLYLIHSLDSKHYLAFKGVTSFNGDYRGVFNFDNRYLRYDAAFIYGIKPSNMEEWGLGILFRKSFNSTFPVLPFASYNRNFNRKWGVEMVLPVNIKVRHNINPKSLLLFGPEFESRTYSIDVDGINKDASTEYHLRRSEVKFTVAYQYNFAPWFWVEAAGGYTRNFTTRFETTDGSNVIEDQLDLSATNGGFARVGIFISPPRR